MHITNLQKIPAFPVTMEGAKDVYKQIPISKADGTPSFSFRVFNIGPGGHTPFHTHNFEHLNYIIEGEGAVITENGEHRVKTGDFLLVMPNERHQYKNTSTQKHLIMICAVPKEYE